MINKNNLQQLTKKQLIELITQYQLKTNYGLIWEQENNLEHITIECKNNIPILTQKNELSLTQNTNKLNHLIIEGDNYHALSVLNYTHNNAIGLIYIDPPYNTGNNDFIYNDSYINKNDTYRHSKWLSFMQNRLQLAKNLLCNNGVIFISIDDTEIAQLKLLCNQIFGEENFIAQFVRKNKSGAGHDSGFIAVEFDYMLCFAKNIKAVAFLKETQDVENDPKYKLIDEFEQKRGKYYLRDFDYKGSYSPSLDYPIETPDGTIIFAGGKNGKPNTWRWSVDKFKWGLENKFIVFKKNKNQWKVYIKQYQYVDNNNNIRVRQNPYRALIEFTNAKGSSELKQLLGENTFTFPKPVNLIKFILNLMPDKNLIILDFFAGSGTTGQAIIEQNQLDGGQRQFILCNNNEQNKTNKNVVAPLTVTEKGICSEILYQRLKKVINGYDNNLPIAANLLYFKAQFIPVTPPLNILTKQIKQACITAICLKENIFTPYLHTANYAVFVQNNSCLIIYFEEDSCTDFNEQWLKTNKIPNLPKILYYFNNPNNKHKTTLALNNIAVKLIPLPILELYKQLFVLH